MNKLIPLNAETSARTGFNYKVVLDYVAVAALGAVTTGTIQLLPTGNGLIPGTTNVPVGFSVLRTGFYLETAFDFSDAAINSLLLEVGDDGSTNRFQGQTQIAIDGTEIIYEVTKATSLPYSYNTANGIDLFLTVAGGGSPTMVECTSGKIHIFFFCVDLNDLKIPI